MKPSVPGAICIRELRWLRRHMPELTDQCDDLEAVIRRRLGLRPRARRAYKPKDRQAQEAIA